MQNHHHVRNLRRWFHTRFFRDHADALRDYEQMKASITAILSRISGVSDDDDRHQMS